jgi:hypothetical protein
MADWSPTGGPYSVSDRASASAQLERGYRRLVRYYPRSFRQQNTEEIIAVLLATARPGQRRPSPAEAADLLLGAARMRLGLSRCPRSVLYAVRLMYLGALAEVAKLACLLLSLGTLRAAAKAIAIGSLGPHPDPAAVARVTAEAGTVVSTDITAEVALSLAAIGCWLFLAWANGRGAPPARGGAVIACAFYTAVSVLVLAKGDLVIDPAVVIAFWTVTAIGITACALLLIRQSWPYFDRPATAR